MNDNPDIRAMPSALLLKFSAGVVLLPFPSAKLVPLATPSTGVTSVGDVLSTTATVPVLAVTPVPPFATGKVPVTPVVSGNPVQLVRTPDCGVPKIGVTNVGDVAKTLLPVPVLVVSAANR